MKKLSLSLRLVIVIVFAAAAAAAAIGANASGYRPLDSVRELLGFAPPAPITAPAKAESAAAMPSAPKLRAPASAFTPGNLVVFRVGNGATTLTGSAAPAFLDEYTTAGVYVQSFSLPTTVATSGNRALTVGGSAVSEGQISPSADGQYLSIAGYNAAVGTASVAGTTNNGGGTDVNRVVGRVDAYGNIDTSTALIGAVGASIFTGNSIRSSAISGTSIYVGGGNSPYIGLTSLGSNSAPSVTNSSSAVRVVKIFGGDLYYSTGTTVNKFSGTPVAGSNTPTPLVSSGLSSAGAFVLLDIGNTGSLNTCYLADAGTLKKYAVSGTTFTAKGSAIITGSGSTESGVTATVSGTSVTLYISSAGKIETITDSTGVAGTLSGTASALTLSGSPVTLGSNAAFRGISFTPTVLPPPPTVQFSEHNPQGSETGPITITVTRSGNLSNASSVGYTTLGGGSSCTTGVDFLNTFGTLNFDPNETEKQFNIATCDDDIYEGSSEGFEVKLQNPVGAVLGTENDVIFSILENDGIPTFDISTAATSVDEGVGTVAITVNRSGAPGNDVSVDLGVGGGTATIGASCTAGVDYVGGGQHLLFPPGTTSVPYNITICNDAVTEPAETFTATLSNPQNPAAAQLGTTTAEAFTINASDPTATTVYVDSSWNCTTPGTDPDGDGPATSCGTDAFTTIADGIAGVADGGSVIINPGTYDSDMRVGHPSIIKGKFTITGELEAQVAGVTVSPGQSPGIITSGSLVLAPGSDLNIELNGTNPGTGHDQMNVTAGPVSIGGANLVLSALGGYRPASGNQFTIINNQGPGAVIGTFAGLAEGAIVSDGTSSYTISYTGGDGNDVVLTATTGGCGNVISIPAVASPTGVSATVPVNTTDLTGLDVIASDFVVTYDPAVLNPATINVTAGTAASPGATVTFNASVPGTIVISVFNGTIGGSFTGPGPLVNITANVIGTLGTTPLTVTGGGFNGGLVCSSSANGSIQVAQAATTTTVTSNVNPSTFGSTVTFTATIASTPAVGNNGTVDFVIDSTTVCAAVAVVAGEATCQTSSLTVPGSPHVVVANYLGATNYAPSSGTLSGGQTVDPATPVITVTGSNTFTYNGTPQGPDTADTGGSTSLPTFSYSGTTNGAVPYGPSATKPTLAGSYSVTASVVADTNYTAASSAPFSFTIGRATPVVTVTGSTTFTYNGSPQGPNTATPGGSTGTLSFSYEGTANGGGTYASSATPPTNAGNYTVIASVAQDDNYASASSSATPFTIERATPTLSVTNSPVAYDSFGHSAAVSASVPGGVSNILTGIMASQTDIGVYAVTADFAPTDANNYNTLSGASSGNFEIVAANVIVERPGTANWFYFDDATNSIIPGHDFVAGPGTPPLQLGSARFLSTGSTLKVLGTQMFNGTRLADISTLSYQTYVQSGFEAASAPMLQFNVDFDLTTADTDYQGRVVYVPVQNGTVTAGTWQAWDTLNGVFWYSDFVPLPTRDECTPAAPCTKAQMLALHPNMGIHAGQIGGLLFRAQADSNANVDDLTIGVTAPNAVTIFDFEQATSTVTVDCPDPSYEYTGSPIALCSASYLTSDGLSGFLTVNYTANTDVTPVVTASATYPGDDNHAGSSGSDTFAITPKLVTVLTADNGKTYGDADPVPLTTADLSGFIPADGISASFSRDPGSTVGTYHITTTLIDPNTKIGNYTVTNTGATFTISQAGSTTTVLASDAEYDGNPHGGTASWTSTGADAETASLTVTYVGRAGTVYGPSTTAPTTAGKYTASADFAGDTNHSGSSGTPKDFEITAKPVTVATADNGKTYGDADPAPLTTADLSGFVGSDGITASFNRDSGSTVGTYHITTSLNDPNLKLGNYSVTNAGATFTIGQAGSTAIVLASDAVYDGNPHGGTASWTSTGADAETASLTVTFVGRAGTVYGPSTTAPTAAGKYTASASFAGDTNHTGSSGTPKDFEIFKKTLVITPDPQTVLYGAADPPFTFSYSGFVLPEGPGNLTTPPVCSVTGTSPHAPGNYTISCIAGTAVNYDFDVTATANFLVNSGSIAGSVNYLIDPKPVPNVKLDALGSSPFFGTSSVSGTYLLNGFGAGAYTVTPSRTSESCGGTNGVQANDATLIAQYVVGLASLTDDQKLAADVSGGPTPTISSFDAALVAQRVVCLANPINFAGQWKFTPANHTYSSGVTANLTGENFNAYLLGDVDGNWNPAGTSRPELLSQPTKDSINVSVPSWTATSGSVVTVPFRVENLGGRSVGAYQFDIEYDPAVVSPADIAADLEGTLGSNLSIASNSPEPGRLKVAVYGAFPTTGDGTYVNLRFTVLGSAGSATPLNISNVVINDGSEPVFASAGSLSVTASANNGAIRGRLLSATGQPVGNARVTLTSTTGSLRSATTNPFGFFEIGSLSVGETYTVSVESKRYSFTPRTVSMTDGIVELDMIADQ